MKMPIYLDYAATTPVDERVAEVMSKCLTKEGYFGNPASRSHMYGWQAEEQVEIARESVATLINADIREIVWTSGATESNNLAIKGVVDYLKETQALKSGHIITSAIEHKAVLDPCALLEKQGFDVSYIEPTPQGEIRASDIEAALREDTVLISVMHINNEVGTINDIAAIGSVAKTAGVLFHVDAAQSAGKLSLDMDVLPVDLMSLSAHKMYGPKGVGALYVRRAPHVKVNAQIHGGGHERGMRSGTLPTHQLAGFGEAARIAKESMAEESEKLAGLRDKLWQGISAIQGIKRNGSASNVSSAHLNVCFSGMNGEILLASLRELAVSSGSACMSASMAPSYVLTAMGLSDEEADSSLRFSVGRYTTEADIESAIEHINQVCNRLLEVV